MVIWKDRAKAEINPKLPKMTLYQVNVSQIQKNHPKLGRLDGNCHQFVNKVGGLIFDFQILTYD
jgi:hypothetical protein